MTFLNPLLLLGLAAAAIPLILHLINLRKLRTIEFSTLAFLKELQRTRIRRLKIRQLLLLALRTLLIVLLVLAFSRPTLRGDLAEGIGSQAKTTAVLLIDESKSMTASDEHGELVKQAQDAAGAVLDLMKEGDELILLRLSSLRPGAPVEQFPPQRSFASLRSALGNMRPASIHRKLDDAIRFSAKLLARSKNFNKEVYVFSDFQKGAFEEAGGNRTQEALFPPDVRVFLIQLGERRPHNLGVVQSSIGSVLLQRDRPFLVKAGIGNYSSSDVRNHVVSLFLNGTRVAEKGLDIRSGEILETEFSVVPSQAGFNEGFVELENDDLEFDNRRYFSVFIPQELRVLLVGRAADLRYLRLALGTRQAAPSSIRLSETEPNRLTAGLLGSSDVVILANVRTLLSPQVESLRAFVEGGGGMMVVPGPEVSAPVFNLAFAPLNLPLFVATESLNPKGNSANDEGFLSFGRLELQHPLFEGMFEPSTPFRRAGASAPSVESPRVRTYVRFSPSPTSSVVISLSNGSPFLLEHRLGEGRVLLLSVAANLEWSDFPLKGLFVPLLHQAVLFLTKQQATQKSVTAGEEAVLTSLPSGPRRLTVENPQKVDLIVHPSRTGLTRTIRFEQTEEIGIYRVKEGATVARTFSVNMDPGESNTSPAEPAMIERALKRIGIEGTAFRRITQAEEVPRAVLESRYGIELWKHFLVASLLIALVEMIVARESKGQNP